MQHINKPDETCNAQKEMWIMWYTLLNEINTFIHQERIKVIENESGIIKWQKISNKRSFEYSND